MWRSVDGLFCTVLLGTFFKNVLLECGGKTAIYNSSNGTIELAPGSDKYSSNAHCEWLIKAPQPGQKILLTFKEFDTECSFDYLKVYDGTAGQRLLGAFSGSTVPSAIISNTSSIVLEFFSDNNYVRKGCAIDFVISECPGNCSSHGNCVNGICVCDELFTGEACDREICPQFCNNATGNGHCSQSEGCQCNSGYIGQSCSFSLGDDVDTDSWHMIKDHSSVFQSRFGHAGVFAVNENTFWIFGGSNLNKVFDELVKFSFKENKWQLVQTAGNRPAGRSRHTLVMYKDSLVLFGGELANGTLLNDLWLFDILTSTWELLPGNNAPPGLASHCASVHGKELIVFAGQTEDRGFSEHMYTYDLVVQDSWKRITFKLAKISDLRLVGHTCVFYPALQSLVVFAGYKAVTGRESIKTNTVLLYHVKGRVWLPIVTSGAEPKPTAYHSSVIIGDHMVTYGGVVHTHYSDEKCYGDDVYLLNLKNFTWSSLMSNNNASSSNIRGRYSHVAVVFNQSTLLVAGGFSGIANHDFLALKMPPGIKINDLNSIHNCHMFSQCIPCVTWGSQPDLQCSWCVQDSTCYPQGSLSGSCSLGRSSRGWWGDQGELLDTEVKCRIRDYPPGLMSTITFQYNLDDVRLVNPLIEVFNTSLAGRLPKISSPYRVGVKWFGFIYPFLFQSTAKPVSLLLRIGGMSASVYLGVDGSSEQTDKVISSKSTSKSVAEFSAEAVRPSGMALFPNASTKNMYYFEVKAEFQGTAKNARLEVFMNDKLLNGRYVRPYFSANCEQYLSCLECMSDVSCGWCSSSSECVKRTTQCQDSSGGNIFLVLNTSYCETCAQHINCESCSKDDYCTWRAVLAGTVHENCVGRGRAEIKDQAKQCSPSCHSHSDCESCTGNTKCLWCEKRHKCIPWVFHPAGFIHGQCSHWSDIFTLEGRCTSCNELSTCAECWKAKHCGWCGEFHNGSCFAGGYDHPDGGSCDQLISGTANSNSYKWSYAECPDENECITRNDCDENADCFDTLGSYKCECRPGYKGNGTFCKPLCSPPCEHGNCIKHATNDSLDRCVCDLGWTGSVCSINCGCHNHSTCYTGVGICDDCQDFTHGEHCERCVPGSYGSATNAAGCARCRCNGHGDERRGICNGTTGDCFCMNNTMGAHCDQCLPGFTGFPQRGEGCYYACKANSVLSSFSRGTLSSLPERGQNYDPNDVNCVWIITTSSLPSYQVLHDKQAPGTITFQIKDIEIDCQTDHVYIYDAMPSDSDAKSSFHLLGALCGNEASSLPVVESHSGTLVVVFKGNVGQNSLTNGFNASFVVNQCPHSCTGNRYCLRNGTHENCVCKPGWTGAACSDVICPSNCNESDDHGTCDKISGRCACKHGFAGPSCEIQTISDDFVWQDVSASRSTSLARMGHTMVADLQTKSLIVYGGCSLPLGILGDVWTYETLTKSFRRDASASTQLSPRYFHASGIYKRIMFVVGGIADTGYLSDVWKYDLDTKQWKEAQVLPREIAGHTVNIVNETMYVIGGYSPAKQCSSKVYTLDLDYINAPWKDLNPAGGTFDGCFGHSSVYDRATDSLVVFGKKARIMEPTLAILKLTTKKWVVVPNVLQTLLRYFHVSMIVGDVMVVTTGYTGYDIQHFAGQPLVYDLRCGSWHKPVLKGTVPSYVAHSAITSMDGMTYMFGGYNGLSSDTLFHENISSNWCSLFSAESSCIDVRNCVWCVDPTSNLSACYSSDTHSLVHLTCTSARNVCRDEGSVMPIASPLTSSNDVCIGNSVPGGCSSCIEAQDGTSLPCSWSVASHHCFSFDFQPIECAFGICGRVLRHYDVCPIACSTSTYCYDCLEQYNCGWCANGSQNGLGVCTEGTLLGSYDGMCDTANGGTWVPSICLPEDECVNGNHRCNENETCADLDSSYKCNCNLGYERKNGLCEPICSQGCVRGSCIDPDKCVCNFGWVGNNCSTACQCYDKGHCVNETSLDQCENCRDHTTGTSCHRCLPGYVGKNGQCKSCREMCHKNAETCHDPDKDSSPYGPSDERNLKCECNENSEGNFCQDCKIGFFQSNKKCVRCKCRGHAASCHRKTGIDCQCKNRTVTPDPADSNNQCSLCSSPYLGNPYTEGQQCYRALRILGRLSFAREDSRILYPRQTSFYYVSPSYTNADIRLTIDVFHGLLDVYISNTDNAFKVDSDQNISVVLTPITRPKVSSDGLNTYLKFTGDYRVIVLNKVTRRLVVTFPFNEHQLDEKKFYIVIKAGESDADGILYFKQDTAKMNLIVFFIVFASCFVFLLSSICMGWNVANYIRAYLIAIAVGKTEERLHNRPFAKYPFLFEYQSPTPSALRHRKTTASTRRAVRAVSSQCTSDFRATVTTVMFQMPQTEKTKMTVSLGTTLTLLTPQQLNELTQPTPKLVDETTL